MKTQVDKSNRFAAFALTIATILAAATPAMGHGHGGFGGGGGGHMGGSGMGGRNMSALSRGIGSFNGNSGFSTKSFKGNQFHNTKLNGTTNGSLNTIPKVAKPLHLPGNSTNVLSKNAKILTPVNSSVLSKATGLSTKVNGSVLGHVTNAQTSNVSILNKAGSLGTSVVGKHGTGIVPPVGGFKTLPYSPQGGSFAKGGGFPHAIGHCGFGGLGFYPFLYGVGGYGGGNYGGVTYVSGGTTVIENTPAATVQPVTPVVVASADASPVLATPAVDGIDLQVVDVRLVDNGDASKQIGPRYRVTFRNAGSNPVDHEFNVALVAADDTNPTASNLPTIESRVSSVATGDLAQVDLRLPSTAFEMGSDSQSEFAKLFVFVDSRGEVNDANRDNNAAGVDRVAVQPAS